MELLFLVLVVVLTVAGCFLQYILRSVLLAGLVFTAALLLLGWSIFML
jgi:hypothetical protein